MLFAAVAALGYSVVTHDSETAPVVVDFPTVDEMRAENMEIRRQAAAAAAAIEAHSFPSNDEMRAENQIIRDQVAAAAAADNLPTDTSEGPVQRPTRNLP